jgi:serine protease
MHDEGRSEAAEPLRAIVIRLRRPTKPSVRDLRRTRGRLAKFIVAHNLDNRRLVLMVSPQRILELERIARRRGGKPDHSLSAYWILDAARTDEPIPTLLRGLRALPEVANAYRRPQLAPAVVSNPNDTYYSAHQGYLQPAAQGIDAGWAWERSIDGSGITFIDAELAWGIRANGTINHNDLPNPQIHGPNTLTGASARHGLANLGIVSAITNNARGIAGAAPGVDVECYSAHDGSPYGNAAQAIVQVSDAKALDPAAVIVLLVEVQTAQGHPVEVDPAVRVAIQTAAGHGIVIIEPAGNAGVDLATIGVPSGAGQSGAIIVAGGRGGQVEGGSNYGARVDCHAWGAGVYTTGGIGASPTPNVGPDDPDRYTTNYGGSSAASAIVAGAAVLVQSAYKAGPGPLTSAAMRGLLNTTGTPVGAAGSVGRMPNLRNILHDVYIRDTLADDGSGPSAGLVCLSPDIIVTTTQVADPQGTYGAGSPNENLDTLGGRVEFGQPNYVYVRMKNRGTGTATGVTVKVWWADAATLITPSMWNLIGTTAPVDVSGQLAVTQALPWTSVPAEGHYCFVAVARHPLDRAPPDPTGGWAEFENFIRNENNAAWRNFNVIDVLPNVAQPAPFQVTGADDQEREFELEVLQHRGRQARIFLEMELALAELLPERIRRSFAIDEEALLARIEIPRDGPMELGAVGLPAGSHYECRFVIRALRAISGRTVPTVAMRQLHEGYEVGRVTWGYRTVRASEASRSA